MTVITYHSPPPAEGLWELSATCGSPIEVMLLNALTEYAEATERTLWGAVGGELLPPTAYHLAGASGENETQLQVRLQFPIGQYRLDFLLQFVVGIGGGAPDAQVVIECDGHAYHERTPEQAERDRTRDRHLQALGLPVFRFTGRELHRDAFACAVECVQFLEAQVEK